MILVIDASVIIKWLVQDPGRETGTDHATRLLEAVVKGDQSVSQPIHWLAEVGAVLAHESPITAADDVTMLNALELPVADEPQALRLGVELAIELGQHLFDTLYHAVALESEDGILVTADERYLRAARSKGRIMNLMDWQWGRRRRSMTLTDANVREVEKRMQARLNGQRRARSAHYDRCGERIVVVLSNGLELGRASKGSVRARSRRHVLRSNGLKTAGSHARHSDLGGRYLWGRISP